jgi:hypothetical protein
MQKHWLALVLVTASACGSDGVSIDDYAAKYLDAYCSYAVRCNDAPSVAECKASNSVNSGSSATLLDAVHGGTVGYDEGQAQACLDEVSGQNCNFEGFYTTSACEDVFEGKVAMGGACQLDTQCAGGANCNQTDMNCDPDVMCCAGTCGAASTPVAMGGSCAAETAECAAGTYCNGSDVCAALITTAGTACDSFLACANPMICNIFADSPTCEKPAGTGETCSLDALIPCADFSQFCDPATTKCVADLAVGASCPEGTDCVGYATCVSGTCQKNSAAGGTCSETGVDCLGDLDCTNGTCTAEPASTSCL